MTKLLSCPFCGQQDAFVEQLDSDASVVICQGMVDEHSACLARGPVGVQQSDLEDQPGRDAAIAEWNRRAQPAEAGRPGDWEWLKLMAEVAEQDRPWNPRLGMTDVEMAYAQSASPSKVLELIAALSSVTAERDRLRAALESALAALEQFNETVEGEFGVGRSLAELEAAGELDPSVVAARAALAAKEA